MNFLYGRNFYGIITFVFTIFLNLLSDDDPFDFNRLILLLFYEFSKLFEKQFIALELEFY